MSHEANSAVVPAEAGPSNQWRILRSRSANRAAGVYWVPACARTTATNSGGSLLLAAPRSRLLSQIAPQPLAHLVGPFRRPGAKAFAGFHAELAGLDLLLQE